MQEAVQFLVRYGYEVLLVWVFAEQIGLPVPTVPLFLAAGALAGAGRMSLALIISVAVLGSSLSDIFWYSVGRRRGASVLGRLCRISLEPDSCVRRTENFFARHGIRSLLAAKFIPGLNIAAAPLAGTLRMPFARFLLFDLLGVFFWAGAYAGLGYLFSDQLERLGAYATGLGISLGVILLATLLGYIAWKYVRRQRFLRMLRIARITPEQLKQKLEAGEELLILDLRHALDFQDDPHTIPGAVHVNVEDLKNEHRDVPRDREIILYCT